MPQQKALKLVRASAGSGKTFALTAHYLTLLFNGKGKYREILAVTFTNKATAEMKERILGALEQLALSGYEKSNFSPILKNNFPDISDLEMRAKASEIYSSILHDYSRFSVSTIDGFVQQLIRSFAFELNLDSGYKLELNQDKVKEELVSALNLRLEKDPELLEWVTNLAIERINDGNDWNYQRSLKDLASEIFKERYYPFQEAMLVMGKDQGKEFNALRVEINQGITVFKKDISDQAAKIHELFELSGIEKGMLDQQSNNPLFKLDKIVAEKFEYVKSFEKYLDNFDQWPHKTLKDTSALLHLFETINPLLNALVEAYNTGSAMYYAYQAIAKNSAYLRLMQGMADLLKNYRSENKTLLISDAQQLLRGITGSDVDNPSFIWEKTGNKFKHFLFDEFQDTSSFQWMNFLPLVKNAIAEGSPGIQASHLVVGDVKQSIYRWRNGDWRILHSDLKHDLLADNVAEEELLFNRRSSENVIRFNNFLFQKLPSILQNQLNDIFTDSGLNYLQEYWDQGNSELIVKAYEASSQEITESTLPGGKIEIKFFFKGEEPEDDDVNPLAANYAIERIVELLNQGFSMNDIGILVRTNSEAVQILDSIFQNSNYTKLTAAAGKTFQVISGEALKIENNPVVQLLLSTFKLLSVREPESGIYKAECARLWFQVRNPGLEQVGISAEDWIGFSFKSVSELKDILPAELCSSFNSYRQLPVNELAEKLISNYQLGTGLTENHVPFLLAFRDQLALFTSAGDQGITAFLDWWDKEGSAKALPSSKNQDAVQVMTVHKSKGLEFRAVIVPFLDWKLNKSSTGAIKKLMWVDAEAAGFEKFNSLPVDYTKSLASTVFAGEYFEEMLLNYMDELNTLYVASTRAKDYLCIICPKTPILKPTSKVPPNDIQFFLSELLQSDGIDEFNLNFEDNQYSFGEMPVHVQKNDSPKDHGQLIIHDYHVNEQLTERFKRNSMNEDNWFNAKQRKGIVLHEILETLTGSGNLEKLIAEKVQEGLIREAEREEIRQAVSDVLMQHEIKEWFEKARSIISEKDMIIDSGVVKRPDKLFILEDRAVLLDFKFGAQNNKYISDISLYRDNLIKMSEFEQVDAYLWYAQDRKLQKV